MFREIQVGERLIPMECNAATNVRFKHVFKTDLYDALNNEEATAGDNIETLTRLAYIMSVHASKTGFDNVNEDTYMEWLEGFDATDWMLAVHDVIQLYYNQKQTTSKPKKKAR